MAAQDLLYTLALVEKGILDVAALFRLDVPRVCLDDQDAWFAPVLDQAVLAVVEDVAEIADHRDRDLVKLLRPTAVLGGLHHLPREVRELGVELQLEPQILVLAVRALGAPSQQLTGVGALREEKVEESPADLRPWLLRRWGAHIAFCGLAAPAQVEALAVAVQLGAWYSADTLYAVAATEPDELVTPTGDGGLGHHGDEPRVSLLRDFIDDNVEIEESCLRHARLLSEVRHPGVCYQALPEVLLPPRYLVAGVGGGDSEVRDAKCLRKTDELPQDVDPPA